MNVIKNDDGTLTITGLNQIQFNTLFTGIANYVETMTVTTADVPKSETEQIWTKAGQDLYNIMEPHAVDDGLVN